MLRFLIPDSVSACGMRIREHLRSPRGTPTPLHHGGHAGVGWGREGRTDGVAEELEGGEAGAAEGVLQEQAARRVLQLRAVHRNRLRRPPAPVGSGRGGTLQHDKKNKPQKS